MIKTFNWLVLGNKYEIYFFYKRNEEKEKEKNVNTTDMTLGNLSYHRKKEKYDLMSEIYFSFQKNTFLW